MKNWMMIICGLVIVHTSTAQEKAIIDNSKSPYVKHKSINLGDCKWTEGFWADKFKIAEQSMVPYMGELLTGDTGHALNNFKIAAGLKEGVHKGMRWHDGDFYKYMEAAMYVYSQNGDKKILEEIDGYIDIIGQAQEEDGYLQTQIQLNPKVDRFENRKYHEMYNSGHLLTSACIHYRISGQRNFLDIAVKHADQMYSVFMPESKYYGRFGFNQTQIMGLVELYRTTGDKKYLKLAEKFINNRGKYSVEDTPPTKGYPIGDMVQERTPLRKSNEAVGHAVLALYYYAGAADVYAETGEQALIDALDRLWFNVTEQKMYVTGALGQTHYGASTNRDKIEEGFIDKYMMPNLTAYNETCANVCNSMFSFRMLGLHGESKYADIMELVLFNSALSGINLEGDKYYYANPLRTIDGARDYAKMNTEFPERQPYLECFCCPPNLVRTIAKMSGWAYSLTEKGIAVNLYGGNKLDTKLLDGSTLKLKQETMYPWEGAVAITVESAKKAPFEMLLRIPDWATGTKVLVNGKDAGVEVVAGQFAKIERKWAKGDVVTIDMPMNVSLVEGNPKIEEVRNQVAVKRGPVVYCIESPDLPKDASIVDVYLPSSKPLVAEYKADFLGGVTTIQGDLLIRKDTNDDKMYHTVSKPEWTTYKTQFIPYYSWSNRGSNTEMSVFVPVVWE
ncbi:glycoside hydrolase family 127 protein [Reichenbachiella carrageenanivorans]|uniref:Glycoside hydrolase family 127 protein n=1 Tax=Reichenbachiella carrageenanivorans TaxID=2979869 RepID=A0ABY6D2U0_9BACT|nr:glycoside hydrolase family 127 protein [Reichenbachiella carrageenanivorans]UXX79378.1 glycoside hydrolase family 127 protein [Reichenbachiella carrageenanivorans]